MPRFCSGKKNKHYRVGCLGKLKIVLLNGILFANDCPNHPFPLAYIFLFNFSFQAKIAKNILLTEYTQGHLTKHYPQKEDTVQELLCKIVIDPEKLGPRPRKSGPRKIWTPKKLDPEKPGPWKTWTLKYMDPEKHGMNMGPPRRHTTSFHRRKDVLRWPTTSYRRWNEAVCLQGLALISDFK